MNTLHKLTGHWLKKGFVIVPFLIPLSFIFLFESAMAFTFPIFVENTLQSNILMGLIMSTSSIVGLAADFLVPKLLKGRTWRFQLLASLIVAIPFPILTLLGKEWTLALFFLFGSALWGLYFELQSFAQQSFIVSEEQPKRFSRDWAVIFGVWSFSGILGPILGAQLLIMNSWLAMSILLSIIGVALVFAWIATMILHKRGGDLPSDSKPEHVTVLHEFQVWRKLSKRVYPAVVVGTTAKFIEASYWVFGGLFAQSALKTFRGFNLDWVIILAYSIPLTIGPLFLYKLNIQTQKKRASHISLILGGIPLLSIVLLQGRIELVLAVIVVSSFLVSGAEPLNESVYSDLLTRAGEFRDELLGISRASISLAYILAPTIMGTISELFGYYWTFSFLGFAIIIIGLTMILVTPRKLRLPHTELEQI